MPSLFFCLMLPLAADPTVSADAVLLNGKIWTVDPAKPEAEAVAVWRGRILTVGTDAEVKALAGPGTTVDRPRRQARRARVSTTATSTCSAAGSGSRRSRSRTRRTRRSSASGSRSSTRSCRATAGCSAATGTTTATFDGKLPTAAMHRQVRAGPAGLHAPLRRPHGPGQHGGAEAGRHHGGDEGPCPAASSTARRRQGADRPAARQRDGPGRSIWFPSRPTTRSPRRFALPQKPRPRSASPACRTWTAADRDTRRKLFRVSSSWPARAS